jgi:hypothetical protein
VSQGSFSYYFPQAKTDVAVAVFLPLHEEIWSAPLKRFEIPVTTPELLTVKTAWRDLALNMQKGKVEARLYFALLDALRVLPNPQVVCARLADDRAVIAKWARSIAPDVADYFPVTYAFCLVFAQLIDACRLWAFGQSDELPSDLIPQLSELFWSAKADRTKRRPKTNLGDGAHAETNTSRQATLLLEIGTPRRSKIERGPECRRKRQLSPLKSI